MKTTSILAVLAISFSGSLFAQDTFTARAKVLERDKNFHPTLVERDLPYLLSPDHLEGKYFKMVKGKSDETISLHDDPELVLRAANAYYHLNKARDFFVNTMHSDYVRNLPKITSRVELLNDFSPLGHFKNDASATQYNNALTVPAADPDDMDFLRNHGITPWNIEIWFRPLKRVNIKDLKVKNPGLGDWGSVLSTVRNQVNMSTLQRFMGQMVQSAQHPDSQNAQDFWSWDTVLRYGGTTFMLEAVYREAEPLNRAFSQKWYWLDTAMVPEIIYHEFTHVALSDKLELSHSTGVIEGMADYFAGVIANSPNLATKIHEYNSYNGKKAKNKEMYKVEFETTDWANADFVFGMLWDLRTVLGEDKANEFIFILHNKLHTSDSIRKQFIEGILDTCNEVCANPFVDRVNILKRYSKKGI